MTAETMVTPTCSCVRHTDGSVTKFLCSMHADTDPCLTMARVTGRRRTGTIRRGACTACGHGSEASTAAHGHVIERANDGAK